mmetsp:Transcript_29496/g.60473  ORF Transcript_29496/g.60473 Transcript_29496/m.60473 type:complete len:287 (+) Transcript_29496:691-1551(+)
MSNVSTTPSTWQLPMAYIAPPATDALFASHMVEVDVAELEPSKNIPPPFVAWLYLTMFPSSNTDDVERTHMAPPCTSWSLPLRIHPNPFVSHSELFAWISQLSLAYNPPPLFARFLKNTLRVSMRCVTLWMATAPPSMATLMLHRDAEELTVLFCACNPPPSIAELSLNPHDAKSRFEVTEHTPPPSLSALLRVHALFVAVTKESIDVKPPPLDASFSIHSVKFPVRTVRAFAIAPPPSGAELFFKTQLVRSTETLEFAAIPPPSTVALLDNHCVPVAESVQWSSA